jgi:hypothetical protein
MPKPFELINKTFGKLVVVSRTTPLHSGTAAYWLCLCACGNETVASSGHLTNGLKKSCGCAQGGKGDYHKDRTGKIFGRLTVICAINPPKGKKGIYWKCLCECGKEKIVKTHELVSGGTQSCGCQRKARTHNGIKEVLKYNPLISKKCIKFLYIINCVYDLMPKEWTELVLNSNGRCAVCNAQFENSTDVSIDHDHATNKVRELVCQTCNRWMGFFENLTIKSRIEAYLTKHR